MKEKEAGILTTDALEAMYALNCNRVKLHKVTQERYRKTLDTLGQLLRIKVKEFSVECTKNGALPVAFETEHMIDGTVMIAESLRRDLAKIPPAPNFLTRAINFLKGITRGT